MSVLNRELEWVELKMLTFVSWMGLYSRDNRKIPEKAIALLTCRVLQNLCSRILPTSPKLLW